LRYAEEMERMMSETRTTKTIDYMSIQILNYNAKREIIYLWGLLAGSVGGFTRRYYYD
jgi:hypothetical protein